MFRNSTAETLLPLAILMSAVLTVSAAAQYGAPPPGRAPQRPAFLQYISGEVSFAPSATNEWKAAQLNQPLRSIGVRMDGDELACGNQFWRWLPPHEF